MIISREKYWKSVRKEKQSNNLFHIFLDEECLRSDKGNIVKLSEQLADEIVREWGMDGKVDAIKNSLFTKFCFTALDITEKEREAVLDHLVDYGNCDPICYIADEPIKLHLKQKKLYNPIINWVEKFFSIRLNRGTGLLFIEQPSLNAGIIKKYLEEFDNFHLTAIHELTKSLGSLFTCLAVYKDVVCPELAWEVANVEDNFRIEIWGEVEEEMQKKNVDSDHFKFLVKILQII
jgi:chaperone required for assembly of F1-ATPase